MKKHTLRWLLVILAFATIGCEKTDNRLDWLIPEDEVRDGGPGKDGIPSVDNPQFTTVDAIDFLDDNDLVIGVKVGSEIKAYPHTILDWHEIVNDIIEDRALAITYCPLTGTGIGWERRVDGQLTSFGVSGLLYNSNLIPYDRATDSNWSQMELRSVSGDLSGIRIETYPVVETSWETWKVMFPNSLVMTTSTGFSRDYDRYPYGDYSTNHDNLIFPVSRDDGRLDRKVRGLGIIVGESSKFYPVSTFNSAHPGYIADEVGGMEVIVIGKEAHNYVVAFDRRLSDGSLLEPLASPGPKGSVLTDVEGNEWNLFGEAISGPRAGEQLRAVESYIGYWFAWGAFYPDIQLDQ